MQKNKINKKVEALISEVLNIEIKRLQDLKKFNLQL